MSLFSLPIKEKLNKIMKELKMQVNSTCLIEHIFTLKYASSALSEVISYQCPNNNVHRKENYKTLKNIRKNLPKFFQ